MKSAVDGWLIAVDAVAEEGDSGSRSGRNRSWWKDPCWTCESLASKRLFSCIRHKEAAVVDCRMACVGGFLRTT